MAIPQFQNALPWQQLQSQANAFQGLGQNPQQAMAGLGQNYADAYTGALNLNAGIYNNANTNYDTLRQQQDDLYGTIFKSYTQNMGDVLGRIAGTNSSNLRDIDTAYTAQSAKSAQDMISRGLGNSTVQQNMQRAIALDRERARTNSQNQFAQLEASYMDRIGQNFINSQENAAAARTALGSEQARFGASVQAPYPNAGMYSQMAQMYGAQAAQAGGQENPYSFFTGGGGGGGGYTVGPSSGGMRPPGNPGLNFHRPQGGGGGIFGGGSWGGGSFSPTPADWGFSGGGQTYYDPSADNYGAGWGEGSTDTYGMDPYVGQGASGDQGGFYDSGGDWYNYDTGEWS